MDRLLLRNFLIFIVLTIACFVGLLGMLATRGKDITNSENWVTHSYRFINLADSLPTLVESMLASQRGFIITQKKEFMDEYEQHKLEMSRSLAEISDLGKDNPSQLSRLAEIRGYYAGLTFNLEDRAKKFTVMNNRDFVHGMDTVDGLRKNILRLHLDIVDEEQDLLSQRIKKVEVLKDQYFRTMLVGGITCIVLMILLNTFLFKSYRRRTDAEKNLKISEGRFVLAAEGANDGIYDWDMTTNMVFCSGAYFSMLGIDKMPQSVPLEDLHKLIHPDDLENILVHVSQYLRGEVPNFSSVFRARHTSGRWVWISSRAKALYDETGKPYRMVGAHIDISALKAQQERLEEARREAEVANLAKTDFLAHMSHEIRTPLTAICGIAEILGKQKDTLQEKQKSLVTTLVSSSKALKDLINDVLDYSKIEYGEITFNLAEFEPVDIFGQVSEIVSESAKAKGLSYTFDYSAFKGETITGDALRIRQILLNLIGNSIKFTDMGSIIVRASHAMNADGVSMMRIDITDTGIGIEPNAADLIFERFKQGDSTISRKYGGTGLGLPISRNLARLMGGDVTFVSEKGRGTTFTLILPVTVTKTDILVPEEFERSEKIREANRKLAPLHIVSERVLMVDDYEGNLIVVGHILDEMGLSYDVAHNGLEALKLINTRPYGLVLMDVQMPIMDGIVATKNIRKTEEENDSVPIPIIGMTAHALAGDRNRCLDAGMDAYLSKPVLEDELRSAIREYLPASQMVPNNKRPT